MGGHLASTIALNVLCILLMEYSGTSHALGAEESVLISEVS